MKKELIKTTFPAVLLVFLLLIGGALLLTNHLTKHLLFPQIPVFAKDVTVQNWQPGDPVPSKEECQDRSSSRQYCGGATGKGGAQQWCNQPTLVGCGHDHDNGSPTCRWVIGVCGYSGICKPIICNSTPSCGPCKEDNPNTQGGTCDKPSDGTQSCIYTRYSPSSQYPGKSCIPKTFTQKCWQDFCHYPKWVCDSVANNCVYTIANTGLEGSNSHLNQ